MQRRRSGYPGGGECMHRGGELAGRLHRNGGSCAEKPFSTIHFPMSSMPPSCRLGERGPAREAWVFVTSSGRLRTQRTPRPSRLGGHSAPCGEALQREKPSFAHPKRSPPANSKDFSSAVFPAPSLLRVGARNARVTAVPRLGPRSSCVVP